MVKIEQQFDYKITESINNNSFNKLKWFYWFASIFIIFCGIIALLIYFMSVSEGLEGNVFSLILGIISILIGCLFIPPIAKRLIIDPLQKKIDKKHPLLSANTKQIFIFNEEKITIETIKENSLKENIEGDYNIFYKVVEFEDSWSLFLNPLLRLVVLKDKIVDGSVEELNQIFFKNIKTKKFKHL